jgi:exodeoxyribonuclease V gamma subunit
LPLPDDEALRWRDLSLDALEDFFRHPARFIVRQRLGIRFEADDGAPAEREPFELDPLARYRIGQAILAMLREGGDPARLLEVSRAAGELPHGSAGELLFRRLQAEVEIFFKKAGRFLPAEAESARDGDWSANGFRLSGRISGLYPGLCLQMRFADVGARDFIRAWIRHLFRGCLGDSPSAPHTVLIGKDAVWSFGKVPDPAALLQGLLALYWQGVCAPLRFFPRSALAFVRQRPHGEDDEARALVAARRQWIGSEHVSGESDDLYYRLCFDPADALNAEFQRLAVQIFEPMFAHAERLQ